MADYLKVSALADLNMDDLVHVLEHPQNRIKTSWTSQTDKQTYIESRNVIGNVTIRLPLATFLEVPNSNRGRPAIARPLRLWIGLGIGLGIGLWVGLGIGLGLEV